MSVPSCKLRRVQADATHLNAGLWGSRFVGECEIVSDGERVWLMGLRVPLWVGWGRVFGFLALLPAGFAAGVLLTETVLGHRGYPPYYYLAAALLTFLLVVLGLWGAALWHRDLSSFDTVSWPLSKGRPLTALFDHDSRRCRAWWVTMNRFFTTTGLVQVAVPIGPGGRPRRLVLKPKEAGTQSVLAVLSGQCDDLPAADPGDTEDDADPWGWKRT